MRVMVIIIALQFCICFLCSTFVFFSVCLCVHDIHGFHYSILFCDIHPSQCLSLCCSWRLFHSGLVHEDRYSELLQWSNRVGRCISSWQEKRELAAVWANLGRHGVGLWDFVLTSAQSWAPIVPNMDMGYGILEPTTLVIIFGGKIFMNFVS